MRVGAVQNWQWTKFRHTEELTPRVPARRTLQRDLAFFARGRRVWLTDADWSAAPSDRNSSARPISPSLSSPPSPLHLLVIFPPSHCTVHLAHTRPLRSPSPIFNMKGMLSCITIARPQTMHSTPPLLTYTSHLTLTVNESISVAQYPPAAAPPPPPPVREYYRQRRSDTPPQASYQHAPYQLSIADIIRADNDSRHTSHWAIPSATVNPSDTSTTSTPTTPPPAAWSSSHSDSGRSDRSSSLEDVIPPSVWRVGRPAARHPPRATSARRHIAMSHVGPSSSGHPPAFWGVVKNTPAPPLRRRAAAAGVRGNITARQDPAWQAAMKATGKGISVTMGLYLDGEIAVGGVRAATVVRDPPCERCRLAGRECRVVDKARERNIVSGICSFCIRQRRKCAT